MPSPAPSILPRHVRRRRASFVLTSLIDVIFLLVIFFMVSSQITPFSLIGLGPMAREAQPSSVELPAAEAPAAAPAVSLRVQAGRVFIAGRPVTMDDLALALADLAARGIGALVVIPTAGATVQDLVRVLETIKLSGIESVTVLNRRGAAP